MRQGSQCYRSWHASDTHKNPSSQHSSPSPCLFESPNKPLLLSEVLPGTQQVGQYWINGVAFIFVWVLCWGFSGWVVMGWSWWLPAQLHGGNLCLDGKLKAISVMTRSMTALKPNATDTFPWLRGYLRCEPSAYVEVLPALRLFSSKGHLKAKRDKNE